MICIKSRNSYKSLLNKFKVLFLLCEYMCLWQNFIVNNQQNVKYATVHSINKGNKLHFYRLIANLHIFLKVSSIL